MRGAGKRQWLVMALQILKIHLIKKIKERRASQHAADRNVWNTRMPRGNFNIDTPRPPPRKYNYYGSYNEPEPEQVIYVAPPKVKKVTTYKLDGRFLNLMKLLENIKNNYGFLNCFL